MKEVKTQSLLCSPGGICRVSYGCKVKYREQFELKFHLLNGFLTKLVVMGKINAFLHCKTYLLYFHIPTSVFSLPFCYSAVNLRLDFAAFENRSDGMTRTLPAESLPHIYRALHPSILVFIKTFSTNPPPAIKMHSMQR